MLKVTALYIYPIKGLPGINLKSARAENPGFAYDRRMMLVDEHNRFISQREFPALTQFSLSLTEVGLCIQHPQASEELRVPFQLKGDVIEVSIWDDCVAAYKANQNINEWFSNCLKSTCSLVSLFEGSNRNLEEKFNRGDDKVSFADAFPYLMISESSLHYLNQKLPEPVAIQRFRPNIVFSGSAAFEEDTFDELIIGSARFKATRACARCTVTTIDPQTGEKGKEPLQTLSKFRQGDNKIYFGENAMLLSAPANIFVGDEIWVKTKKSGPLLHPDF